jgi:hypothetical protein
MTRPDPVLVDHLAEVMRTDADRELRWALHDIGPDQLTTFEIVAMLAVFRTARARIEAEQAPLAQFTLLRPKPKPTRNRKRPVRV